MVCDSTTHGGNQLTPPPPIPPARRYPLPPLSLAELKVLREGVYTVEVGAERMAMAEALLNLLDTFISHAEDLEPL